MFNFRLACTGDQAMLEFLVRAEMMLCSFRLSSMTSTELYAAIRPLRKLTHHVKASQPHLSPWLREILSLIGYLLGPHDWKTVIGYYNQGAEEYTLMPFYLVPELVARRIVVLKGGMARVPYSHLVTILVRIFFLTLRHGVLTVQGDGLTRLQEPRIQKLVGQLKVTKMMSWLLLALLAFCEGNPPMTGGFPSQRASNAELWCFQFLYWASTGIGFSSERPSDIYLRLVAQEMMKTSITNTVCIRSLYI